MIKIRTITDIKEAEILWRALSPQETVFDDWDFRYTFFKHNPQPLGFLLAEEIFTDGSAGPVGLLPLQKNTAHGCWEFFAEDPCEENRPFVKSGQEEVVSLLYGAAPVPTKIYDISGHDKFTAGLPLEDYKYILPLVGLRNFSDFLQTRLSAKRRRSLSRELEIYEQTRPDVVASQRADWLSDLESLFSFNNLNFAGESYLQIAEQAPWRDLLKLPLDWRLLVIKIKGVKQAVSLSVIYNNHWHYLITGANFHDFPGLGKYLVKVNLEAAIAAGVDVFDAGLGDCGWKHLWHFDRLPQYEFIKEI